MTTNRIKDKIIALRAKTKAAGCTEAEAMAAAAMAAKLMTEHGLSDDDIAMCEAQAKEKESRATWRTALSGMIAFCTNTSSVHIVDPVNGNVVLFIGRAPGPEIALYLRDVCFRAVNAEIRRFKTLKVYRRLRSLANKRAAARDFTTYLVARLCQRLEALFAPLNDSTALQEAEAAIARRFGELETRKIPEHKISNHVAAGAGWRAGADIPLNRGVAGTPEPKALTCLPQPN